MRADKVLRRVMEEQGPIHPEIDRRGSRPDPWEALARAIVGQQLSTRAAASIWNKLLGIFGGSMPTPEEFLRRRRTTLLKAGLSNAKVEYLRDLAARIKDGEDLQPSDLEPGSDENLDIEALGYDEDGRPADADADAHVEDLLDEGLKGTFPASDPVSVSRSSD